MAVKTISISDLSGEVMGDDDRTLTWAFDGQVMEIDLTAAEREKFEKALKPFMEASRKAGRKAANKEASARGVQVTGTPLDDLKGAERKRTLDAIRAHAQASGMEISNRGRLPIEVVQAYYADQG